VDEVESLGLGVVRLEIGVGDRPGGGDAAVVLDLVEVAFTKAQQDAGVDLGVAADEVLGVRAKRDAVLVIPALGCHIPLAAEDLLSLPVLALPRKVAPRSSRRIFLPDGARRCASVPPPAPLPMMITS